MHTVTFDHPGLTLASPYITDLRRRPVPGARLLREAESLLVTFPPGARVQLHVSVGVEGFGRTFCTADRGGEGYANDGRFDLLRELAFSHLHRAERVVSSAEVSNPFALIEAREFFALSAWHDRPRNAMLALAHALLAGEEAARAAAEHTLALRDPVAHPGPLISATLFGERLGDWSIGVGPDWGRDDEPPNFVRPAEHNALVAALCNATTLPNFWRWIEPRPAAPRWEALDPLVEFAAGHNLAIKSFALYWGGIGGSPVWLRGLGYKEKLRYIEHWVERVVRRYKDQVAAWETVNEMHDWFFGDPFGWSHAQALEVTRMVNELVGALDPGKPRIINHCCIWGDYAQDYPGKWTPLTFLDDVVQSGIPFEGIGVQYYNPGRDLLECLLQLDAFAEFGKGIWITEMGTPSDPRPHGQVETGQIDPLAGWRGPWTPDGQANWAELWYTLASARSQVKALNWWDFSDAQSFIAHAGLIDPAGQPKPAYQRLQSWRRKYRIGRADE